MPRGGIRGGGINLRALAIRQIKSRLTIDLVSANGIRVVAPGQNFEDITSALAQLAAVKKLGVPNIRYLRKKILEAHEFFKKPNQQLHLNQISALVDHAEQVCLDRVERRKEKKMLRKIVDSKKTAGATKGRGEIPAQDPPASPMELWKKMLAKQQQEQQEKKS
jgi:hypothetical protein